MGSPVSSSLLWSRNKLRNLWPALHSAPHLNPGTHAKIKCWSWVKYSTSFYPKLHSVIQTKTWIYLTFHLCTLPSLLPEFLKELTLTMNQQPYHLTLCFKCLKHPNVFFLTTFTYYVCKHVCVGAQMPWPTRGGQRTTSKAISFYHVGLGDWTQVLRVGSKRPH